MLRDDLEEWGGGWGERRAREARLFSLFTILPAPPYLVLFLYTEYSAT